MRNNFEMGAHYRRDDVSKWDFTNDDSDAIAKFDIVLMSSADGRPGCQKAKAGANAAAATALFYSVQSVKVGKKAKFFRSGIVDFTTSSAVGTVVYLSASVFGGLTETGPATSIPVGNVIGTNLVFLDLPGMAYVEASPSTTPILSTNEYWVTSEPTLASRQFTTIAAAVAQAATDLSGGTQVIINCADGQTHVLPVLPVTHPLIIRGGTIDGASGGALAGADVTFRDCELTGAQTWVDPDFLNYIDVVGDAAKVRIAKTTSGNAAVSFVRVTGKVRLEESSNTGTGVINATYGQCSLLTTTASVNQTIATMLAGTIIMRDTTITRVGSVILAPFHTNVAQGDTFSLTLENCTVFSDGAALITVAGVTPTLVIDGGDYYVTDIGTAYTTSSLPYMEIGARSGPVAGVDAAASRRICYEAGRGLMYYSPTVGGFLGKGDIIELEFKSHTDSFAQNMVQPANADSIEVHVPASEIWLLEAHRISQNGSTFNSDTRRFLVWNNAGTLTITKDSVTVLTAGSTLLGAIDCVSVVSGSFRITSAAASGYDTHVTLHIKAAMNKAAF